MCVFDCNKIEEYEKDSRATAYHVYEVFNKLETLFARERAIILYTAKNSREKTFTVFVVLYHTANVL